MLVVQNTTDTRLGLDKAAHLRLAAIAVDISMIADVRVHLMRSLCDSSDAIAVFVTFAISIMD